jgi:hypothetical protein
VDLGLALGLVVVYLALSINMYLEWSKNSRALRLRSLTFAVPPVLCPCPTYCSMKLIPLVY